MIITPTDLCRFVDCPLKYKLGKDRTISVPKSPQAVLGIALHQAIHTFLYQIEKRPKAQLRRMDSAENLPLVYYYKSVGSFLSFCARLILEYFGQIRPERPLVKKVPEIRWPENLDEERQEELMKRLLGLGLSMAKRYYQENLTKPAPFSKERTLTVALQEFGGGVKLRGRIDQARKNSKEEIFIVDIKTGRDPLQSSSWGHHLSLPRRAPLYMNLQLAAYHLLWERVYKKKPLRVGLYYLQTGNIYWLEISSSHLQMLFDVIRQVIRAGEEESFPPFGMLRGKCRFCDFWEVCQPLAESSLIEPATVDSLEETLPPLEELRAELQEHARLLEARQLRLKLRKSK